MVGNSIGQPPACQTPRLTASASSRKWMWQWLTSLQVWAMPTIGLARSMSSNPEALLQARMVIPQPRASSAPRVLREKESLMKGYDTDAAKRHRGGAGKSVGGGGRTGPSTFFEGGGAAGLLASSNFSR